MKPAIKVHVEYVLSENHRRTLFIDSKDIPVGMTPKKCARWILNAAMEKLQEPEEHQPGRD